MLSDSQKQEILSIINKQHLFFIANQVGASLLTQDDIKLLQSYGFQLPADFNNQDTKFDHAFKFGILAQSLGDKAVKNMSYNDFKKYLKAQNYIPLNQTERAAVNFVKQRAYNDIKGLGNRIQSKIWNILIEQDQKQRQEYQNIIRDQATRAVARRKSVRQLSSDLGNITKDWARDFDRIADYVMHSAYENGRVHSIIRNHGNNSEVWFDVYKGACKHCVNLYLTSGPGSKPKVFKLKQIISNGSNIGRKTSEWKAVVPPVHPWCRCSMNYKKDGFEWDESTRAFSKPVRNDRGVKRESKPKITISYE